jgi:thiol-disulfide isomerase/thioredoxin
LRSAIALLLLALPMVGGCDRQSPPGQQPTQASPAPKTGAVKLRAPDRTHRGEAAPTIPFRDSAGKQVTLADFAGKPVLLNLWATWCAPCVKEMPTLDALAAAKGDALQVVALSQDFEGAAKVAPFFAKAKYQKLRPYLDTDAAFSMTMGLNLPATILYDSGGREVWRMLGDTDWAGAEAAALIAEAR